MTHHNIEEILGEMSALNNELVNTKRNLVKKTAEIEKLNEQLKSVNTELEQFTYLASHDLKEPLRMVRTFAARLEKEYAAQLDEKAKKYIHFAVDGANRMTVLINELLAYAKIGGDERGREAVDIDTVLDEIIKMHQGILTENGGSVTHVLMPTVPAFKVPVKMLFQNLVSNGLKYVRKGVIPEVKISFKENADHWQFAVADNGIGICAADHEKIFHLFKRLQTKENYPGTGMGLATCKKIVEKHGGEIWVESEEGKGSTFYFTILKTTSV